jgi:carotenoid cleavage dioxygenase-like enzyme
VGWRGGFRKTWFKNKGITVQAFTKHAVCLLYIVSRSVALAQEADLPDAFEQIIPRGRIAAISDPVYVPADEAEIKPDAWVLGVVVAGQARAYSLTLLNSHEVVNDTLGGIAFAAVW